MRVHMDLTDMTKAESDAGNKFILTMTFGHQVRYLVGVAEQGGGYGCACNRGELAARIWRTSGHSNR